MCVPSPIVPFSLDPDFVDRLDILIWLHEKLATPVNRAALVGLGSVGFLSSLILYYLVNLTRCQEVTARHSALLQRLSSVAGPLGILDIRRHANKLRERLPSSCQNHKDERLGESKSEFSAACS
jgi:hypothetical protein